MSTTATPTEDGQAYIIEGEKLWCTNGPLAEIIVVMARTPDIEVNGRKRKQITAFLVESAMPGFEVVHRCSFMGLNGIQNGVVRFNNVRVPKENIIWGLGKGLKLALVTLNAGRIAIPAGSVGSSKYCLRVCREWSLKRNQWGKPIGHHEAVAQRLGNMAATTFAMDALVWLTSALVDRKIIDIRLEAAMAKLYCSEAAWTIIDDALQIRGGRGYESADSLKARGEAPIPIERIMRDARINRIIEGTSDIMHLFIAREALDAHMRQLQAILNPKASVPRRIQALLKAVGYYVTWYPRLWISWGYWPRYNRLGGPLAEHVRFIHRASRKLARILFHSAVWHQTRLADRQQLLSRLVDIGGDLFAMTAACSKAKAMLDKHPNATSPLQLANTFCRIARSRIRNTFHDIQSNADKSTQQTSAQLLQNQFIWMEQGII